VCLRRAEQGEDGVAAELLERSAVTLAWYGATSAFTSSGSSCSERAVEPTRSTKIAVITFRSSLGATTG